MVFKFALKEASNRNGEGAGLDVTEVPQKTSNRREVELRGQRYDQFILKLKGFQTRLSF